MDKISITEFTDKVLLFPITNFPWNVRSIVLAATVKDQGEKLVMLPTTPEFSAELQVIIPNGNATVKVILVEI
jgi:hypothetical protein